MESNQPDGRPVRLSAPSWLAGPLATLPGLAAHVAGGGQPPAIAIVAALAALLSLAAVVLERVVVGRDRPASAQLPGWAFLVAAAAAQQLLHLAFAAFATASPVPLPGHGHGGPPTPDAPSSPISPATHSLHLMLYLHAGAALLNAAAAARWNRLTRALRRKQARVRT